MEDASCPQQDANGSASNMRGVLVLLDNFGGNSRGLRGSPLAEGSPQMSVWAIPQQLIRI